jgi:hypothetical protein
MSTEANDTARTAALKFADALASLFRAYLIGSLAHGRLNLASKLLLT